MTDNPEDDKINKRIELFDCYHNDQDQYHNFFTELGLSFMVDECDGNCHDCNDKGSREVFLKITDDGEN